VTLLVWFWISNIAILFGLGLNSELDKNFVACVRNAPLRR